MTPIPEITAEGREIKRMWREYTEAYGVGHPISWELACWVAEFHRERKFTSACDIGSGFTSWLLRYLKIPHILTYDAHRKYLDRTVEFLADHRDGLGEGLFAFWPPERDDCAGTFDLILYDSAANGGGSDRTAQIPLVASMVAPGGFIVVDDFNWQELRGYVRGYFAALGWPVESLERRTRDQMDRYAGLVGPRP